MPKLWGEIPNEPDTESGIAAIEREQITKPRPLEVEGCDLFIPPQPKSVPRTWNNAVPCQITMHTLNLSRYYRTLERALQDSQSQAPVDPSQPGPSHKSGEPAALPPPPPLPELPECVLTHRRPGDITGRSRDSLFVRGKYAERVPFLDKQYLARNWEKYTSTICCHAGFESSFPSVLKVLADIGEEFVIRLCKAFRLNRDIHWRTGYKEVGYLKDPIDTLEDTFLELRLGSMAKLHNFYQTRIVDYHEAVLKKCQEITKEYEKARLPKPTSDDDEPKPKKKKEEITSSEIKFPVTEESEDSHQEASQIPLQLEELQGDLQNMEQDASTALKDEESMKWVGGQNSKKECFQRRTNTIDPEEEMINVGDSAPADIDISRSIPSVTAPDTMSPSSNVDSSHSSRQKKK